MKKPIIAVDIDEVLFPFTPGIADFHNEKYGTNLTIDDFFSYSFWRVWGGDNDEAVRKVSEFMVSDHLKLIPIEGAKEAVEMLVDEYEIFLVTARNGQFEKETVAWLKMHLPLLFDKVHFAGNPYDGLAYKTKLEVCREINAQLLIDDSPNNVLICHEGGLETILFGDYGWNTGEAAKELPKTITRCKNWAEVLTYLESKELSYGLSPKS